jgi:multicomponent Na+:H+ antiporter subunit C
MYNNFIYIAATFTFCTGLYIILSSKNYFKRLIGLAIFQNSVLIFYIGFGKIDGAIVPIYTETIVNYSNPLPHVLMLTAIVVGFSTMSVGIAMIYKIKEKFGSIDENIIKTEGF